MFLGKMSIIQIAVSVGFELNVRRLSRENIVQQARILFEEAAYTLLLSLWIQDLEGN